MEVFMTKQLIPEALNEIWELQGLKKSPSGTRVLFMARRADTTKNHYLYQLWLIEGREKSLLLEQVTPFPYDWASDELVILASNFTEDDQQAAKSKVTSFYLLDTVTKQLRPAFRTPFLVEQVSYFNAHTLLLETFLPTSSKEILTTQDVGEKTTSDLEQSLHAFSELPFYQNDRGFLDHRKRGLVAVDQQTGNFFRVTPAEFDLAHYVADPSSDGLWLTGQYQKNGIKGNNDHLLKINLNTRKAQLEFADSQFDIQNVSVVEESIYLLATNHDEWGYIQLPKLYQLVDGTLKLVADNDLDLSTTIDLSTGTNSYSAIALKGYSSSVVRENLLHDFSPLYDFEGIIYEAVVLKDRVVFLGRKANELSEVFEADYDWQEVTELTEFNTEFYQKYHRSLLERVTVGNSDGWVVKPRDYQKGHKYPGILVIHGGPHAAFSEVYQFNIQLLVNQGYFVFFANPRGSAGKGNAFAELRGKTGIWDYSDLNEFVQAMLDRYVAIDDTRLGITGISYGGYLTNWFMTQSNLFKTAISENGVSNWISQASTSDVGYNYVQHYSGDPLYQADQAWNLSPLKYAKEVKIPVLFIHSDQDYRCPVSEGLQMYSLVKRLGNPTEFVLFHGENHSFSREGRPKNRLKRHQIIAKWFEKHLTE